ncbi:uncharacterized protein LOC135218287 isoform X2 [Macrobrachium nipponense]|uniref:uncharacterized protein LOC135218287 isoform X2 n=1 Tax=Macrobrachium nipponense TaxID=159736 RepID=UPI0030C89EAB
MIYLIMVVFSTIALPSCTGMESALHSARTKQAVSPSFTSRASPDTTLSKETSGKPYLLYPLFRRQESSTLDVVTNLSFSTHSVFGLSLDKHSSWQGSSLSKGCGHRKHNYKGKVISGTNGEENLRTRRKLAEHKLRIRPVLNSHYRHKNLETEQQNRSSDIRTFKIDERNLMSNTSEVDDRVLENKLKKKIFDFKKPMNGDPLSLSAVSELHSLANNVLRMTTDSMKNSQNCDKVKRSVDSKNLEEAFDEGIRQPGNWSSVLQETSNDSRGLNLENPDPSRVSPNAHETRGSINITKTTNSTRRGKRRRRGRRRQQQSKDLALWIDEQQVKLFSGYTMEIFVIHDGKVLPYILDPNFEKHLPVIPYEVQRVNFTWQAGRRRYYYTFDRLFSHNPEILEAPVVSLSPKGRVPRKPKVFTVNLYCFGNSSGIASFEIGLLMQTRRGKPLPGTPLRLKLRKECTQSSVDPECDEKCENGGVCDVGRKCQCPEGYMGPYCNTALCYPQCMNGGTCTTPGRCTCPPGYQGRHCEGGICREKCENGGKCIQKDTCACPRGYYGNRCEFSKCVIPCINGGRCRNVNKCRCPRGFAGDHCEVVTGHNIGALSLIRCSRKCRHGSCSGTNCICKEGFTGKWCRRRGNSRKRVWM